MNQKEYIAYYWMPYQVGSLSRAQFFAAVDRELLEQSSPDIWLIELSALENCNDDHRLRTYVEEYLFGGNDIEFKYVISLKCYREEVIDIKSLHKLFRRYFIDEEYGEFLWPENKVVELYEDWRGHNSMLSDEEYYEKLAKLFNQS